MIKAVADTKVYLSSVLFGGKPEGIRILAREGKIELLISENILAEIAEAQIVKDSIRFHGPLWMWMSIIYLYKN